ncbi:nucleotidyltransferase [Desulfosarcina ovata subsp. sediminis]|uniref:Nucleotidyltransferase n=1 Tax=Desulfosarcina ovata subsp. sediminis TaxID=885957 RepID=A0A5K7ZIW2_9BACT|nr:nucleotidyltransferase domain-containing protein [Desulfosarcina ovata]BBO81334.1 nucleotidyltransferase [Desulfosarcina ovata subsp. sediminis]
MIRHSKLPNDISERINCAIQYLEKRKDVVFAYLFGGLAKGHATPLSDVDIAVYLDEGVDCIQAKLDILEDLVDILNTDEIDLIVLNHSSLPLSMNVIRNNRLLVDKQPFVRHQHYSLVMRKYLDYSRLELAILKRRFYHG